MNLDTRWALKDTANLYKSEQTADKTAGILNAATTILGGVSKAAGFIPGGGTQITPAAAQYLSQTGTASGLTDSKNGYGTGFAWE